MKPNNNPHGIKLFKSTVERCNRCSRWRGRYPTFWEGDLVEDWCDCGCSSIKTDGGRPYGATSKDWGLYISKSDEFWPLFYADQVDDFFVFESEEARLNAIATVGTGNGNTIRIKIEVEEVES